MFLFFYKNIFLKTSTIRSATLKSGYGCYEFCEKLKESTNCEVEDDALFSRLLMER